MSLATNVQNLATRIATETKQLRTLLNGNAADLSALTTTAKTNLVAAINELQAEIEAGGGGGGVQIDDVTASTTTVYSSTRTNTAIAAAIAALVDSAPETLDTLNELAAALGDDPNFAATTATALGNRVRFDAAQTLTAPQKVQANANAGSLSLVQSGDPETNFVTTFESGLV